MGNDNLYKWYGYLYSCVSFWQGSWFEWKLQFPCLTYISHLLPRFRCECQHHTCGETCNQCCAGYNQKLWQPAMQGESHGCEGECGSEGEWRWEYRAPVFHSPLLSHRTAAMFAACWERWWLRFGLLWTQRVICLLSASSVITVSTQVAGMVISDIYASYQVD